MIKAVQRQLGPGYTITHLGHAAVLLAQIKWSKQKNLVGTVEIPLSQDHHFRELLRGT